MSSISRVAGAGVTCTATMSSGPVRVCSSCGCTLSSGWGSQGFAAGAGFGIGLRADYFNQDQLRRGTGTVDTGAIVFPTDREIQEKTINRRQRQATKYMPIAVAVPSALLPPRTQVRPTPIPGYIHADKENIPPPISA